MFEEGQDAQEVATESVESVEAAEPVESVEPVEAAESVYTEANSDSADAADGESVEAADTSDGEISEEVVDEIVEAVFDWNGELDSLKAAEWLGKLDTRSQDAILRGIETKYRNFERGYTDAYQKNAARRKTLDRREQDVRDQEIRFQQWMHGDVDPMAEKQKEIDSLKVQQEATIRALRDEYDNAMQDLNNGSRTKFDSLVNDLQTVRNELAASNQKIQDMETQQEEINVNEFETWLQQEAPDVMSNDAAFVSLCTMCAGGIDPHDALLMTRAKYPAPQKAEPDPVPPAVDLMNLGTSAASGTASQETRNFDDLLDSLRRQAQQTDLGAG